MIVVLLGVGIALRGGAPLAGQSAGPAATPTIDPRLIIRARTVPVVGQLTHGIQMRGSLNPAYPGRNTLRVVLWQHGRPRAADAPLVLVATMPGMAMAPIHTQLGGRNRGYSGAITLPMFGAYRVQVRVAGPDGLVSGTVSLVLTLPRL